MPESLHKLLAADLGHLLRRMHRLCAPDRETKPRQGNPRPLPAGRTARRLRARGGADRKSGWRGPQLAYGCTGRVHRPLGPAPEPSLGRAGLRLLRRLRDVELPHVPVSFDSPRGRGRRGRDMHGGGERRFVAARQGRPPAQRRAFVGRTCPHLHAPKFENPVPTGRYGRGDDAVW